MSSYMSSWDHVEEFHKKLLYTHCCVMVNAHLPSPKFLTCKIDVEHVWLNMKSSFSGHSRFIPRKCCSTSRIRIRSTIAWIEVYLALWESLNLPTVLHESGRRRITDCVHTLYVLYWSLSWDLWAPDPSLSAMLMSGCARLWSSRNIQFASASGTDSHCQGVVVRFWCREQAPCRSFDLRDR